MFEGELIVRRVVGANQNGIYMSYAYKQSMSMINVRCRAVRCRRQRVLEKDPCVSLCS